MTKQSKQPTQPERIKSPAELRMEEEYNIRFSESETGETIIEEITMEIADDEQPFKQIIYSHKVTIIKPEKYVIAERNGNGRFVAWKPEYKFLKIGDNLELSD